MSHTLTIQDKALVTGTASFSSGVLIIVCSTSVVCGVVKDGVEATGDCLLARGWVKISNSANAAYTITWGIESDSILATVDVPIAPFETAYSAWAWRFPGITGSPTINLIGSSNGESAPSVTMVGTLELDSTSKPHG